LEFLIFFGHLRMRAMMFWFTKANLMQSG
jgi:hypothetical protein